MLGCFSMSTSCFLFFLPHQRVFRKEHQLVYFWPSGSYNNLNTSSLKLLMCDIKYFGNILSTFSRRRWRTSFWGNLKEDESFAGKLKPYSSWCPSYDVKYFYIFCKGFLWRRIRTIKILLLEMPFIAHPKKEWVSNKHSVSPKHRFYVWKSTKPNVWTI